MKNARKLCLKIGIGFIFIGGIVGCDGCETVEPDQIVTADEVKGIIIPTEQAKELYDTYAERRVGLIRDFENALDSVRQEDDPNNTNPKEQNKKDQLKKATIQKRASQQIDGGFQPTRYGFSDFESLKKYMSFIEQEAEKANVKISTLRFYFANYPDKDNFDNNTKVKEPRRNTLVFVPTVNTGDEEFAFFTADDSEDGERKAFLLTEELVENNESFGGNGKDKASFFPKSNLFRPTLIALQPENKQPLNGNEWGLRPPK